MVARLDKVQLLSQAKIVAAPSQRSCEDRTFELPPALHVMVATLFLGFVSVLSAAFANPEMAVPYVVFAVFIVAFFAVPALWARMEPEGSRTRALSWREFREMGVDTATGRESAASATVLVLLLPALIFFWAVAVATIAALV